jgi:23S rRNA (pseudouridine1915-N3)-methyltransferase
LKFSLIAIGKTRQGPFADLTRDYRDRIGRLHPFELQEISDRGYHEGQDIQRQLEKEAEAIHRRCKPGSCVIVLDEHGKQFTSVDLAKEFKKFFESGMKEVVFIVGGAYGLAGSIKAKAELTWSLSKLTLPHQLARVLTLEQIYRALTILKNVPYHHD